MSICTMLASLYLNEITRYKLKPCPRSLKRCDTSCEYVFANYYISYNCLVWFRNRLLSGGLEPVLSQTEKSYITSNYRQFSTNIKIKIIKLITVC